MTMARSRANVWDPGSYAPGLLAPSSVATKLRKDWLVGPQDWVRTMGHLGHWIRGILGTHPMTKREGHRKGLLTKSRP